MLAQVTMLRHWKSEHTAETCEDAVGVNSAYGLFAVADGAGTTLFSGAWADFLVRHFLTIPLMVADPFEVEWWVRLAQGQFKQDLPAQTDLAWNAQQKVQNQGSYSTLATLRFSAQNATRVRAELLAIGDSCIFVNRSSIEQPLSFPLQHAAEFEQAPICIPSKTGAFNRYFHQFQAMTLDLVPSDVVVLATDAVAKWIVSAGNGRYGGQGAALQEIVSQTAESWPAFIQTRRANQEMLDDDSTALVIALQLDTAGAGSDFGTTVEHSQQVRVQRKQDFGQAQADENKEHMAIYYGAGIDLQAEGVVLSPQEVAQVRAVADALREVLSLLRQVVNNPDMVPVMTAAWQKHAELLYREPCAATVRNTLARLGVPVEPRMDIASIETSVLPVAPIAPIAPVAPSPVTNEDSTEDDTMLLTQVFEVRPDPRPTQADQQMGEV